MLFAQSSPPMNRTPEVARSVHAYTDLHRSPSRLMSIKRKRYATYQRSSHSERPGHSNAHMGPSCPFGTSIYLSASCFCVRGCIQGDGVALTHAAEKCGYHSISDMSTCNRRGARAGLVGPGWPLRAYLVWRRVRAEANVAVNAEDLLDRELPCLCDIRRCRDLRRP